MHHGRVGTECEVRGGVPEILEAHHGDAVNRGIECLEVHRILVLVHGCLLGSVRVVHGVADGIDGCLVDAGTPSATCRNAVVSNGANIARGWYGSL